MTTLDESQLQFKEELKKLLLSKNRILPFEELEQKAALIAIALFSHLSNTQVDAVVQTLTQEHDVTLTLGGAIVDPKTFEQWLQARKVSTPTPRWDAYEQLLVQRDWNVPVLEKLNQQTDEIVELLGDPEKGGSWARHGLLMGEVQSGKTATYLGVLNKALDYGYRLIIVIGGHTKELRRQTQSRFDSDLIGFQSEYLGDNISGQSIPRIGVGAIDHKLHANVMTTVLEDFSQKSKRAGLTWVTSDTPTIFIIKKNAKLIANVADYIRMQAAGGKLDIPMIVVDDESDWGTPNTGSDTDPTRVNKEIRKLLDVSKRSSYLGITATPFANIFIDDEAQYTHTNLSANGETSDLPDLFPSDYIRVMSSPSNYLGIGQYFGSATHAAVSTEVDDCLVAIPIKHKKDLAVNALPDSLETALMQFLIGTAVRRSRDEQVRPSSMLINVSRFNDVQEQVASQAEDFMLEVAQGVHATFAKSTGAMSPLEKRFVEVWEKTYPDVVDYTWSTLKSVLVEIIHEFKVELVNSRTARERARQRKLLTIAQRDAEDLRPTIYVGGDVISRGLTLDGLQVSYFVREPRTMDTLMQMGRWFGYRPNFSDLVRIWMPETTKNDLDYSAEVAQELRDLLLEMRARELTPRDFGLRVRTNPNSVAIVAANKAKNAALVNIGPVLFENTLEASYKLSSSATTQQSNREAVAKLVTALESSGINRDISSGKFPAWYGVPSSIVLDFFRGFRGPAQDPFWGNSSSAVVPIAEGFSTVKGSDKWDVVFVNGSGATVELGPELEVHQSVRNRMGVEDDVIYLGNRRVSTATDLTSALSGGARAELNAQTSSAALSTEKRALAHIDHPILLVYALTTDDPAPLAGRAPVAVEAGAPLITVAIAFPKLDATEALVAAANAKTYMVNTVWLRNSMDLLDPGDDVDTDEVD